MLRLSVFFIRNTMNSQGNNAVSEVFFVLSTDKPVCHCYDTVDIRNLKNVDKTKTLKFLNYDSKEEL